MQEIFNFLKNNWQLIVGVLTFIASVIVAAIRKKPVNDVLSCIYMAAVKAVNSVETIKVNGEPVSGKDKLNGALYMVARALEADFPNIQVSKYYSLIVSVIENILTTPQKKER